MSVLPKRAEFIHEALLVIGGAILASLILSQLPQVREFIRRNLGRGGCDCDGGL